MSEEINTDEGFDAQERLITDGADEFTIAYIAFHSSFDKRKPINVDVSKYDDEKSRVALHEVLRRHINVVWKAREGISTRTGFFESDALIRRAISNITQDRTKFFEEATKIADDFRERSSKVKASPGILIILQFSRFKQEYFAIFKMHLAELDNIAIPLDSAESLTLKVDRIANSLPQPGKEVLKWIISPHPTLRHVELKYKDRQNQKEPAKYFKDFIACQNRENEKNQLNDLMPMVSDVFTGAGASEIQANKLLATVLASLQKSTAQIDGKSIGKAIKDVAVNLGLRTDVLESKIEEFNNQRIDISPQTVKTSRLRVYLRNEKITIQGPADQLLKYVERVENQNSEYRWTITIHTNGNVDESYV